MIDDTTPSAQTPEAGAVEIPMGTDGPNTVQAWFQRIKDDQRELEPTIETGKKNVNAYRGKSLPHGTILKSDQIVVNKDFANVERKKPELFGQVPTVQLSAELPGLDDAVHVFEAVLNKYLSPKGVHAAAMMEECLFDVLCPTGFAACAIGYQSYVDGTKDVPTGAMIPDPNAPPQPPPMGLGLSAPPPPMIPEMKTIPNIVFEKYFMNRISPAKLIVPKGWSGSDFDKAPYLGQEFAEDFETAKRKYNLPDGFSPTNSKDESRLVDPVNGNAGGRQIIKGFEVWYPAHLFDPTEPNPLQLRQLILIEGYDQPVTHRNSPHQIKGPTGEILGPTGYPIKVLTLRYVSDSAFPPSDCTITRAQVDELGLGRTQMIQQRKRSLPIRWANLEAIGGQPTLDKIENGEVQSIIPVSGNGAEMLGEISRANFPRENFTFNDVIDRDISESWALGPNSVGQPNPKDTSASETNVMSRATSIRMDKERGRCLAYFVSCAEYLGGLIQIFATDMDYIALEGPQGDQTLKQWDKTTIAGKFAYSAAPDSSIRVDAAEQKQQALKEFQLLRNDPLINQPAFLARTLRKIDLPPAELIAPPQPQLPEHPKVTFSFLGADLNPASPQFPIVVEVLRIGGVVISPESIQQAQAHAIMYASMGQLSGAAGDAGKNPGPGPHPGNTTHPGPVKEVPPLNKHQFDQTGEMAGRPPLVGAPH